MSADCDLEFWNTLSRVLQLIQASFIPKHIFCPLCNAALKTLANNITLINSALYVYMIKRENVRFSIYVKYTYVRDYHDYLS